MRTFSNSLFPIFFLSGFSFTDTDNSQQGKGGDHCLFHSATSTCSQTFRHLFVTLHVKWLSHILISLLVFTRLLFDEIYHFIKLPFDWLMMWSYFLFVYMIIWYFDIRFLYGKPMDLNSHQLSPLYYMRVTYC